MFAFVGKSGYTHSAFGERSHTAAHTPKQGPSRPRPQRGFALPAISLLFHHAFIYIHFPVLCEPPLSAERKIRRNCRHKFYPPAVPHCVFQLLAQMAHVCLHSESGYTLGSRRKIAHKGSHAETRAFRMGGGITTLGAFHTFRKPCVARCQNGKLCRFWVLVGGTPEGHREPAEQRCALMRVAVPQASRPRWAA